MPGGVAGHEVGSGLLTEIVTDALPVLPFVSVAVAVMVCDPFDNEDVFKLLVQLVVPDAVWDGPLSTLIWMSVTPAGSAAVPEMGMVPETLAPPSGAVMATVGVMGATPSCRPKWPMRLFVVAFPAPAR